MVDVPNVEGQSLIPAHGVPAVDDRPPCHSRQNVVPPALLLSVSLQIHRQEGAGSDQAQLASNDVQELRQFVDARRAKELAETGQSLLVGEKFAIQPTRFIHRSQLDDLECLFVEADPRLTKENRGTHRGANGNGCDAKDGGCRHQEARSDGPIDHLLHDETPAGLLHRLLISNRPPEHDTKVVWHQRSCPYATAPAALRQLLPAGPSHGRCGCPLPRGYRVPGRPRAMRSTPRTQYRVT